MMVTTDSNESLDSLQWVDRLRNDATRENAIASLRDILLRGLRGAFLRRGVDDAFCEDMSQEAIIRVLKSLDTFEGRSKFTTWATSIAIRVAISELRKRYNKDVSLDAITGGDNLKIEVPEKDSRSATNNMERVTALNVLKSLINDKLTSKQKTVVQALLGGMPVEEIARKTDSNRNAIYKLFHDAKLRLRSGFEAQEYSASDIERIFP